MFVRLPSLIGALLIVGCMTAAISPSARCQSVGPKPPSTAAADSAAIRTAALDYIEGWYHGDAARMERALHPDLGKRIIAREVNGEAGSVRHMTAAQLVEITGKGAGRRTPPEKRRTDVHILDVFGNVASVRIDAGEWVDYIHLGRFDDGWKIINVLWEYR